MRLLLIPISYLLGSIPFGWLIAKLAKGVDIRKIGSGATGATNTYRATGIRLALLAGVLDILKAAVPTLLAVKKWPKEQRLHILVASAAITGHTKSIFLGFHGGKAVSTTAGAAIALATGEKRLWSVIQVATSGAIGAFTGSRGIVSVTSLTGTALAAIYSGLLVLQGKLSKVYGLGVITAVAYIWLMHRENIQRLLRREEKSILGK
jgi:glycerol-3-phosphate acyltransferase PlsY